MTGNYENFTIDATIKRTRDFRQWETVGRTSNIPKRVFYGAAVFAGKLWIFGGYDGKNYHNDVWSSYDGVEWSRVTDRTAWSSRNISVVAVFKGKLWILGGGLIDGEKSKWENPDSEREVWSSPDGISWTQVSADLKRKWWGTLVVFDEKLWLVGANRGGTFESAAWMTGNGSEWKELPAPWSPRGAVAAWVHHGKLFMTGGKSSHT